MKPTKPSDEPIQRVPEMLAQPRVQDAPDGGLELHAPAKINLNLLVGRRRDDGCHDVDSYVAKITLYDRIRLAPRQDGQVRLSCTGIDCGPAESNLAMRAARLLGAGRADLGADILLDKRIPAGAGLGGGSSDAAAVLWGLDRLWGLRLALDYLAQPAAQLGSDVPLFLGGPSCRMRGRGERITPADIQPFFALLILPPLLCPTPAVYRAFDAAVPPVDRQLPANLLADRPPSAWRDRLVNHLGAPARAVCPPLGELWDRLSGDLPAPVHLTGSGSALFVLCDDAEEARSVAAQVPADLRSHGVMVRANPW